MKSRNAMNERLKSLMPKDRLSRRRFLRFLGLGTAAAALPSVRWRSGASASGECPRRVVFMVTQHGPPPRHWKMNLDGLPGGRDGSVALRDLDRGEFSRVLEPLYDVRENIHVLDGMSMMACMAAAGESPQGNNHGISWATLLTNAPGNYDDPFIGGDGNIHPYPTAISIDQYIAQRVAPEGALPSVVWGTGGRFGSVDGSSVGPDGRWIPLNTEPRNAFARLMENGLDVGGPMPPTPSRADLIAAQRASVLDLASAEYDQLLPQLGAEDRERLARHRDEIRALERRWAPREEGGTVLSCNPEFSPTGDRIDQFFRLTALALSCDVTRVVSLNIGELAATDFGAPPRDDVHHAYAHGDSDEAIRQMGEYYRHHAGQFATLVRYLRDIPEGEGTLLDSTMVVWISELATGHHNFNDCLTLVAGGAASGIRQGQYTRFAQNRPLPCNRYGCDGDGIGPGHSHLFVDALHHMEIDEDSFNRTRTRAVDGAGIDLTGSLPLLT